MLKSIFVVTRLFVLLNAVSVIGGSVRAVPAQVPHNPTARKDVPVSLLRDIPQLQQRISVDATDLPVSEVLNTLTPSLPVDLSAERNVADQRVTLHVVNQPLFLLMDRLTRLLSHHLDSAAGYQWGHLDRAAGARPAYQLWRDQHSVSEEQWEIDYPRREVAVLLRDYRNMAGMSPQELAKYKGDFPYGGEDPKDDPTGRALQGLTDAQIDALAAGEALPLDPALFAKEIAALHQAQVTSAQLSYKAYLAAGYPPRPHALDIPLQVPPQITVTSTSDESSVGDPSLSVPGLYLVSLVGVSDSSAVLDAYDTNANRDPVRLALIKAATPQKPQGPQVDLTPLLTVKTITRDQRRDVGFTLHALAQTAHVNLYQEDFLHGTTEVESSATPDVVGLTTLKGSLPTLLDAICAHWNYQWQKSGDDYLLWSRTWAQDRAEDVSERLLSVWRKRAQSPGGLSASDRAEMAAALSWRQVTRTLSLALPAAGSWQLRDYRGLRVLGQLSPVQAAAARSADGLAFASLAPWQQQSVLESYKKELAAVPDEQLGSATLTLEIGPQPGWAVPLMQISLHSQGNVLLSQSCALMPPAP